MGLELREKLSTLQSIFPLEVQSVHNLRLNVHLSNEIGIFREQVDTRHDSCKSLKYDTSDMPTVSVVIPFYNEIWSVLLRTVTGILFRSPPHLIKEIILVDDGSTFEFLGEPLDYFLKQTPKTRVIHHSSRQGLIQTRMTGAKAASGDVLIFLDSHSEVSPHWLEPLLDGLKKNPRVLYSPVIDWINPDTYEWSYATEIKYSRIYLGFHQCLDGYPRQRQETATHLGLPIAYLHHYRMYHSCQQESVLWIGSFWWGCALSLGRGEYRASLAILDVCRWGTDHALFTSGAYF